jgi:hypothetical protein
MEYEKWNFEWQLLDIIKHNKRNNKSKWKQWNRNELSNITCSKEKNGKDITWMKFVELFIV